MANVLDTHIHDSLAAQTDKAAAERGLVILRVIVRGTKSRPVIEIILDGSRLVAVEDCEAVSKSTADFLDELPGMSKEYRLDVLSPGTDEPLLHPYQFQRSIGRLVEITLSGNSEVIKGYLRSVSDSAITVESKKNQKKISPDSSPMKEIAFVEIGKAHTLVDFTSRSET